MKFVTVGFFLASTLLTCQVTLAAGGLRYLDSSAASAASIPAPPALNSPADSADLAAVLAYQEKRTPVECARAQHERPLDIYDVFGPPYGPLTAEEMDEATPLYNQVKQDTDHFVNLIKMHWNRKRPYLVSQHVKPCLPPEPSSSYPSGHATISRVEARALAELFPLKAAALLGRANEVGLDRVIGGVHHPLDIQAGQSLGDLLFAKMQQNSNFNADVKRAH